MSKEVHDFQADVNEVLSIVVNSLYSKREVFLRELISNASDALDKLTFKALTNHELGKVTGNAGIQIIPDKDNRNLGIRDNGIGMTDSDMRENLGTIARSGSKRLLEQLHKDGKESGDLSLIGQFGVGFYSAFLVADQVTVISRAAGAKDAWRWSSEAKGGFTLERLEGTDPLDGNPGTLVELHLKEDAGEFLEEWTLKSLVRKYSDYVRYPVKMPVTVTKTVGEGEDAKTEEVTEVQTINEASALWARSKSEITEEQYDEFYKHLSHDWESPLARTHFQVEGTRSLTGLLFIPKKPPFDLYSPGERGVSLFVKRVFIADDAKELLPEWLRFVRGVVDSPDLPLNVSREMLQEDATTRFIRKQIVAKTLSLLEELQAEGETEVGEGEEKTTRNRFREFWDNYGKVLKEGVHHEADKRERIGKLLLYESSQDDGLTTLSDYVARMPSNQKAIYYVTADNVATARKSPHCEELTSRGFEVLFMGDPIDEWVVQGLGEFDGKSLVSAAKGSLDLPMTDEEKQEHEDQVKEFAPLTEKVQKALGEHVREVRITERLKDSPACLVVDANGLSPHMARILRANGQDVPDMPRILELNPKHPVVQKLGRTEDESQLTNLSSLLYDQALLAEGSMPSDPAGFARRVADLMARD